MSESRPVRIMRALAAAPQGRPTPALVAELGEAAEPRALSWYGSILRSYAKKGHVEEAGRTPGGWQRCPAVIWRLTDKGREMLAYIDAEPNRQAAFEQARISQEAARQLRIAALAEAASLYSQRTPRSQRRPAAVRLRGLGCTLEEIGQIFGVTREMIRKDCLPYEPRPERAAKVPGPRLVDATVLNGVIAIRVGKRTIYFTRAEAMQLAEIIGSWNSAPASAAQVAP